MERLEIDKAQKAGDVIRAGSDYIPGIWTINIAFESMPPVEPYEPFLLVREDGSTFKAWVVRVEDMDNRETFLCTDEDGALLLGAM